MMKDETNSHYHPKEPRRFSFESTRSGKALSEHSFVAMADDKDEQLSVAAPREQPAAAAAEEAPAAAAAAVEQPVSAEQVEATVN
jgi:hypothetical protein